MKISKIRILMLAGVGLFFGNLWGEITITNKRSRLGYERVFLWLPISQYCEYLGNCGDLTGRFKMIGCGDAMSGRPKLVPLRVNKGQVIKFPDVCNGFVIEDEYTGKPSWNCGQIDLKKHINSFYWQDPVNGQNRPLIKIDDTHYEIVDS